MDNTIQKTNKITLLDEQTRELIAAGEVIERPASALKELIENSIDAGAGKITVEIKEGGLLEIAVTDNGCGMNKDDALASLRRFATSKIKKIEDLNALSTLGFRGEALPSIAAISKMRIFTNDNIDTLGTDVSLEGGRVTETKDIPYQPGTKIIVSDLFFNTPARLKFQKSASAEFSLIYNLISKYALYYKDVHFVFINNGKESLNLPHQLDVLTKFSKFVKQEREDFINFEAETSALKIHGFISVPQVTRKNRDGQAIFVNGRIIKPGLINQAINDAYSQFVERGAYPYVLLFVEINPEYVDVNVHPTKSEVRFADSTSVYKTIFNTVFQKLKQTTRIATNAEFEYGLEGSAYPVKSYDAMKFCFDEGAGGEGSSAKPELYGKIDTTYAFAVIDGALVVIDIHAAHERINYEYFKDRIIAKDNLNQKLLEPVVIEVTPKQQSLFNKYKNIFEKIGFEIEDFGKDTFIVRSVPCNIPTENIKSRLSDLFCELELEDGYLSTGSVDEATDELIKSISCKSSVMAGDNLNYYEIKKIFEDLGKTSMPSCCPHGRPTYVKFDNKELNKIFKRV